MFSVEHGPGAPTLYEGEGGRRLLHGKNKFPLQLKRLRITQQNPQAMQPDTIEKHNEAHKSHHSMSSAIAQATLHKAHAPWPGPGRACLSVGVDCTWRIYGARMNSFAGQSGWENAGTTMTKGEAFGSSVSAVTPNGGPMTAVTRIATPILH